MRRMGKIIVALVLVLLLVLTTACAPAEVEKKAEEKEVVKEAVEKEVVVTATPAVNWGILEIRVTDPPPADVKSAVVHLKNIEVHRVSGNDSARRAFPESDNVSRRRGRPQSDNASVRRSLFRSGNVSDSVGEWVLVVGAPQSFDLMDVIGVEQVLGSANITAGRFTQIRMEVEKVVVTVGGDNFTAEVPSGELKIVRPFNVGGGQRTVLTLDFDGGKSLIVTGKGKALFQPVVKLLIKKE